MIETIYEIGNKKVNVTQLGNFEVQRKLMNKGSQLIGYDIVWFYTYSVTVEVANELVKLNMIDSNDLINCAKSMIFEPSFFTKELENNPQVCMDGIVTKLQETEDDKIDIRYDWGEHIVIVCDKCGLKYHTKNITQIGARSIFNDTESGNFSSCTCEFKHLRIQTEEEYTLNNK